MENLRMRHLIAIPVIVTLAVMGLNRCAPAPVTPKNALMEQKQRNADWAVQKLEKVYSKMTVAERMKGVVYE